MKVNDSADGVYIISYVHMHVHTHVLLHVCTLQHCRQSTCRWEAATGRQQQGLDLISLRITLLLWAARLWLYHLYHPVLLNVSVSLSFRSLLLLLFLFSSLHYLSFCPFISFSFPTPRIAGDSIGFNTKQLYIAAASSSGKTGLSKELE